MTAGTKISSPGHSGQGVGTSADQPQAGAAGRVVELLRNLGKQRNLITNFVTRDLKTRYVGSSLGFFWSVVVPFMYLIVFMFVFSLIFKSRWNDKATPVETSFFMLVGILAWQAHAECLSRITSSLVDNANLIKKVVFPSEVFSVYLTTSALINMLIGFPIVLLGAGVVLGIWPTEAYLALPLVIVLQGVFSIGLGYLFSAVNIYFRDVHQMVGVGTLMWMFGTPVFYPPDMLIAKKVPLPWAPGEELSFAFMLELNPMAWLLEIYRTIILRGEWPDFWLLGRFGLLAFVLFALGAAFFERHKRRFPDLL